MDNPVEKEAHKKALWSGGKEKKKKKTGIGREYLWVGTATVFATGLRNHDKKSTIEKVMKPPGSSRNGKIKAW